MSDPITIPPEALEAAARGVYEAERPDIETLSWENIGEWRREDFRKIARATCLAMLEAWPGNYSLAENDSAEIRGVAAIILPLTENHNDKA